MKLHAYTGEQIRTLRVLLETTEVKGYDNCKNVVMMREIIDHGQIVEVKEEENGEEVENKSDRKRRRLSKPAEGEPAICEPSGSEHSTSEHTTE
jgi:hypothetical protein